MNGDRFRTPLILSMIVMGLIAIASIAGVLTESLYRDNLWVTSQLRGADFVRMILVVPLFAGAIYLTARGSVRGLLVWLGMLWLAAYDYAFYLFGASFNALFLVYTVIFSLSIVTLIRALTLLDVNAIREKFTDRVPVRAISGYMGFWVLMLGGLWLAMSVAFLFTGDVPQSVVDSGHPTAIVFALDLGVLLPAVGLAAYWLWKKEPWGYVLAVMVNVKGATYALALIAMGIFMERAGLEADNLVILWGFFAAASIAATLALLLNMRPGVRTADAPGVVDRRSVAS